MGPFRREGVVRKRRTWVFVIGLVAPLLLLTILWRICGTGPDWLLYLLLAGILPSSWGPLLFFLFVPKKWSGTVSVDAESVLVDDKPIIARSGLREGRRVTKKGRATALLLPHARRGIWPYEIELPSDIDVDAFVAAVRLDRAHKRLTVLVVFGKLRRALLPIAALMLGNLLLGILGGVQHARATARTPETISAAALLGRNGRSAQAWMDALRRLVDDASSYRDPALSPERLWNVVEDPTASLTARGGAAFALRKRVDDSSRERLRIATDACAAPTLRIALGAAASANEEALVTALVALDEEGGARPRA